MLGDLCKFPSEEYFFIKKCFKYSIAKMIRTLPELLKNKSKHTITLAQRKSVDGELVSHEGDKGDLA